MRLNYEKPEGMDGIAVIKKKEKQKKTPTHPTKTISSPLPPHPPSVDGIICCSACYKICTLHTAPGARA